MTIINFVSENEVKIIYIFLPLFFEREGDLNMKDMTSSVTE